MNITRAQILAIMPNARRVVDTYLPYLNRHMAECEINTKERICHFLANIAVESREMQSVTENLNYSAIGLQKTFPKYFNSVTAKAYERQPQKIANRVYANRYGNGNEASGDGWRYRGRGLIQYTFRSNYREYGKWCGYNVEEQPDLLAQPKGAVRSACHYYQSRGCNQLADKGDSDEVIKAIRKKINGGTFGLKEVREYYKKAKAVI